MQYFTPENINEARKWQATKDPANVTLEAVGRSIARIAASVAVVLSKDSTVGLPEAVRQASYPFARLAIPQDPLGEWTAVYMEKLTTLLTLPETLHPELFSSDLINVIIGGLALNAHTITLPKGGAGSGVYVLTANLNHNCSPTARVDMDGKTVDVAVKANRKIASGEEISLSYAPQGLSLAARRERLQKYGFSCVCKKCKDES
eukprot:TRINITY_DN5246_c0_g1_i1.p1 TRINITY_DN5246_c0_g1~~TRINITY_DN5246_c0_g1_i1.p1  ORF type:complete len:204 (+),score=30.28 TRINITY_DN5246_c0_g1_i1:203-814(+)